MDTTTQYDASKDDGIEDEREIIRKALDQIVKEVGTRMGEAGLKLPVYLVVPNSGNAILTLATPIDANDDPQDEWSQINAIVREIVLDRLDGIGLRSQELTSAMVNAT